MFELALWKAKIDQADKTDPDDRDSCRIDVPGPLRRMLFCNIFEVCLISENTICECKEGHYLHLLTT